jgi:hypothetical protein
MELIDVYWNHYGGDVMPDDVSVKNVPNEVMEQLHKERNLNGGLLV